MAHRRPLCWPVSPTAVERQVGVTVSIGLAANRLMAKIAAGRGKPRGFIVIDAEEAAALLAPEPVRLLPGVGAALARKLETLGITRLGQLQVLPEGEAARKLGDDGPALVRRARGEDARHGRSRLGKQNRSAPKRPSIATCPPSPNWNGHLWRLCEKLARRLKEHELAAGGVVLKLKTIAVCLADPRGTAVQPDGAA